MADASDPKLEFVDSKQRTSISKAIINIGWNPFCPGSQTEPSPVGCPGLSDLEETLT